MSLHTKIILNTVHLYLENALKTEVYQRDKLLNIYSKIQGYNIFHKFSVEQHKDLIALGEQEYMLKLKDVEVDFGVYGMELLTLLVGDVPKKDRFMNISDKKILDYKAGMVMDMIRLKDKDGYDNVKDIISSSKMVAKQFYFHTKEKVA